MYTILGHEIRYYIKNYVIKHFEIDILEIPKVISLEKDIGKTKKCRSNPEWVFWNN